MVVSIVQKDAVSEFIGTLNGKWPCCCSSSMKASGDNIGNITPGQGETA
jgi:hypothetical protein